MRLRLLLSALVVAAASTGIADSTMAQTRSSGSEPIRLETIPESFNRAFFNDSGDFYRNRSIGRQIDYIIGPGGLGGAAFPELEIERDAKLINILYEDALNQQFASDPVIRTPDLANPFDTSIRLLPVSARFRPQVSPRIEGSEFFFETVPPR
ncbi:MULTISPECIES: hypothetical protein [unclassified Coleofasciculus]|uniref:hypothetical protein n=1 Tax=unclassified Coleofasciculus TaxID=2692782 RepID=UPI0018815BD2|nr:MULTISPECIES: hypothetical protein [unclassified Coleofasciculus]MBE9129442.1 hypothetical protein [Coleofasciculus sp. LEGE 07081]MBE9148708.1 hypothetical protein [Coleofasciculus sp. LEGE 07092]